MLQYAGYLLYAAASIFNREVEAKIYIRDIYYPQKHSHTLSDIHIIILYKDKKNSVSKFNEFTKLQRLFQKVISSYISCTHRSTETLALESMYCTFAKQIGISFAITSLVFIIIMLFPPKLPALAR